MQGVGSNSAGEDDRSKAFEAKHAAIIARTLRWADEAASRHDYVQALRWLETVEGIGEALPDEYEAKRHGWLQAAHRHGGAARRAGRPHSRRRSSS
jgi:hypothetical protein